MRTKGHCRQRRTHCQWQFVAIGNHTAIRFLCAYAGDQLIALILIKLGIGDLNVVSTAYQRDQYGKRQPPNRPKPRFVLLKTAP